VNARILGFVVLACLLLLVAHAQNQRPAMEGPFPAQGGEICVVCYAPVLANDLVYLINGRRYAVDKFEQAEFLSDPQGYVSRFDQYQARQRRKTLLSVGAGVGTALAASGVLLFLRRRRAAAQSNQNG
jgi:hypothetical protein